MSFLQVVLLDILEVTIGTNLQLYGCLLVANNHAVRVSLDCRCGASVRVSALYCIVQSHSLLVTECQNYNLLSREYGADTNGQSQLRNLVYIVVEETRVYEQGVVSQSLDTGTRVER